MADALPLPSFDASTLTPRRVLVNLQARVVGEDVVLDSSNADAGETPTTRFREGNVVVLETASGRYREADDALGDSNAPASVSAAEAADADWASTTITFLIDGGVSFSVALGAGDDTNAEVVTALNADAQFSNHLIADVSGGVVRIRTREGGATKHLLVTSTLASAFGASGTAANGTDADYRVTAMAARLEDVDGIAVHAPVGNYLAGHFDESELVIGGAAATSSPAWPEARAVLARRGSIFG